VMSGRDRIDARRARARTQAFVTRFARARLERRRRCIEVEMLDRALDFESGAHLGTETRVRKPFLAAQPVLDVDREDARARSRAGGELEQEHAVRARRCLEPHERHAGIRKLGRRAIVPDLDDERPAWIEKPRRLGKDAMDRKCKACRLLLRKVLRSSRVYLKCQLRGNTGGPGTDHRAGWDACKKFVPRPQRERKTAGNKILYCG